MNYRNNFLVTILTISLAIAIASPASARFGRPGLVQSAREDSTKEEKEREGLPLVPGRTLEFTADEGSWISLDVSPDGQTIVFDLLGDLYTIPVSGGNATRLTSGMAYDVQPRFSPDGKRVVFISDSTGSDNVWLLDLDSKERKALTKGKTDSYLSPEWTPDGHYIVVSKGRARFGVGKLWLIHVDGGTGVALIKEKGGQNKPRNQQVKTIGAAFGKDGRYIWYAQRRGDWQYNAVFPQYQLARYDRETGESSVMTSRFGSAIRPTLSPDGKWLAFATRYEHETGLRLRDLATGEEKWLAYPVQRDDQEARATMDAYPGYSFTPDSKSIIVSYGGKIWNVPIDGSAAQNIAFTAHVNIPLGPEVRFDYKVGDEPTFVARQIRDAVPSPDGKRLAFTALDRLWVMDLGNGTPKRLTKSNVGEHYPIWSPDGKWLAYVTWSDTDGGHINKVRSTGGNPVQLTRMAAVYRMPAWSPDGKRIVAIRAHARDMQESISFFMGGLAEQFIYVPAAGGTTVVIVPAEDRSAPHFTDDPERIYAYSRREGLVSMRWDGTDVKKHVKVTGAKIPGAQNPITASLVLIAPRGDQALAQVNNDLYVVTVPYVGGETPTVSVADPEKAAFPARKLTEIGGQFPTWGADASKVHWSIGNAFLTYDLKAAKAFEDSLDAAAKAEEGSEADKKKDKKHKAKYHPKEQRIEIIANRDIPRGNLLLRGARAITMKGHEIIENADVLITNNRIASVGKQGDVQVPGDARIIDISGKTIIPGFVDTHAHMRPARNIHNAQVWTYLANLAYGVTTTRDPQTGTTDVLSYSDLVETGAMVGPRIYSTGPGVFWTEQIKDLDHARHVLRRYSDYYDTKTFKMYMSGNRQQRQWLIMAAKELKLMPTTEGGLDFKLNMTHAMDGYPGLEHSLPITPLYSDIVHLFVKTGITYTPTLLVAYGGPWAENYFYTTENVFGNEKLRRFTPHAELASKSLRRGNRPGPAGWAHRKEQVFDRHAKFVADLIEAGGRSGVGSHGQLQGMGYHWELWAIQSGGLSEHDALRVATIYGARAIGFGNDLGSIESGKIADLVIFDQNPLENIRNTNTIKYVMKNGRLYEGDTLDEVWPRQQKLPEPYWRNDGPHTAAGVR